MFALELAMGLLLGLGPLQRAQDTFYVGNLEDVRRVYQQRFIDTYAKVACAKLYDRKTPSPPRVCSTTGCCRSSKRTRLSCCAC